MQWYADNSELNGIWKAELPDILMFGGIAVRKPAIGALSEVIDGVKARYSSDTHFPIKYNIRDLRKWYESQRLLELYKKLRSESKEWRQELVNRSLGCEYKVVIACVTLFGPEADRIKQSKELVTRFCFADALMRISLLTKEYNATKCDIILDWPDRNRHQPYTEEYRSAYVHGHCHEFPDIKYYSGPLRTLRFSDSPLFTRMEDCALLQFSDIVVGAAREFIEFSLKRKDETSLGVQLTKTLVPKYRGYPNRIVGRGISIAPKGGNFRHKVFEAMFSLRHGVNQTLHRTSENAGL